MAQKQSKSKDKGPVKVHGESADTRELTNLYNKRTALTPAEKKRVAELEKKLGVNENMNKEHPAKAVLPLSETLQHCVLQHRLERSVVAFHCIHRPSPRHLGLLLLQGLPAVDRSLHSESLHLKQSCRARIQRMPNVESWLYRLQL